MKPWLIFLVAYAITFALFWRWCKRAAVWMRDRDRYPVHGL